MSKIQERLYQAMKVEAKRRQIKASPEHDLYKMIPPYFIDTFYIQMPSQEASGKITIYLRYEVKYSYFDDITAFIIEGETQKLTDKVRANSLIKCTSIITEENIDFDFDGNDESYPNLSARVFDHIEKWYHYFFDEVKEKYGDLETFFICNKEKYPRQAALIYINSGNYTAAEECLKIMPSKMQIEILTDRPLSKEQEQRRIDSKKVYGANIGRIGRDYMDIHFDFIIAKKKGLEWNVERAKYGLLKNEREFVHSNHSWRSRQLQKIIS
ncbi:MAG: hypothetical protein J6T60_00335 [Bacteroidales bacterium]|nr:hypothetical protein [Bacteroidales bacterium]MBO7565534.1 hypothetical protein [Bacteroidales bacterium]